MLRQCFTQLGAQAPFLLVYLEVTCAALTGDSVCRVLRRERRRRQRREMALGRYVRAMEDFPELARQSHPKFNDDFERKMSNDITYHLGRNEPSCWGALLRRLGQRPSPL